MNKLIKTYIAIISLCLAFFSLPQLKSSDSLVLNVKDYGAIGNGKNDDSVAIQKALLDGANHKIYFPNGQYKVSKELLVTDNTEIYGSNSIIKSFSDLLTVVRVKGANIQIHNLSIDGNNTSLRGITISEGSSNVVVLKNTLQNFSQPKTSTLSDLTVAAIKIEGSTSKIMIDNNKINNAKAKNPVRGWGHLVARGILISPENSKQSTSKDITIKNSTFTNIGPKDDGDGIVIQGFKDKVNLKILNNYFSYNYKRAIKIQTPGAIIRGNKIYNSFNKNNFYTTYPETKAYDMWAAISVYANDILIDNNHISGTGNFGRAIDIANSNNVNVLNNYIANGSKGNYKNSDLIVISNNNTPVIKNFLITNNTVVNGRYGIYALSKIPGLKISNNNHINVKDFQPFPSGFYRELKYGNRGKDVSLLHSLLNKANYKLKPDGVFDSLTKSKLIAYQKAKKINVTGVADKNTLRFLTSKTTK